MLRTGFAIPKQSGSNAFHSELETHTPWGYSSFLCRMAKKWRFCPRPSKRGFWTVFPSKSVRCSGTPGGVLSHCTESTSTDHREILTRPHIRTQTQSLYCGSKSIAGVMTKRPDPYLEAPVYGYVEPDESVEIDLRDLQSDNPVRM